MALSGRDRIMESPHKMRQIIGKFLLFSLLFLTGLAAYLQFTSATVSALSGKENSLLHTAILTQPGMTVSYNPSTKKVTLNTVKRKKLPQDPLENARDLLLKSGLQTMQLKYYIPKTNKRDEYWELFKFNLSQWHHNPLIIAEIAWDYISALHDKRTNLNPAEFWLYALALTDLEITDFTANNIDSKTKKKKTSAQSSKDYISSPVEDLAPLAQSNRPLLVEILNASGKKGVAAELAQFLRDKYQKGLLMVDVLNYDNYPGGRQKHTYIVDFSGRLNQVKQLSTAMGLHNEIVSEKVPHDIYDARIIIGEDYKQPL